MKAIQVSIDEELLQRLDADPDVQQDGRSAVMRRAVAAHLRARRERRIADAYREGYGDSRGIELRSLGIECSTDRFRMLCGQYPC